MYPRRKLSKKYTAISSYRKSRGWVERVGYLSFFVLVVLLALVVTVDLVVLMFMVSNNIEVVVEVFFDKQVFVPISIVIAAASVSSDKESIKGLVGWFCLLYFSSFYLLVFFYVSSFDNASGVEYYVFILNAFALCVGMGGVLSSLAFMFLEKKIVYPLRDKIRKDNGRLR